MIQRLPKRLWFFVGFSILFALNAAWLTRSDSPYSFYTTNYDVEIVNLTLEKDKLTKATTLMTVSVPVNGELINRSSRTVTMVDLDIKIYSCPRRGDSTFADCDVAVTAKVSPVVMAEPGQTRRFSETIYVSRIDLPIKRNIAWRHDVLFVHTR